MSPAGHEVAQPPSWPRIVVAISQGDPDRAKMAKELFYAGVKEAIIEAELAPR